MQETLTGLSNPFMICLPGLSLRSNRWAEISPRLRRTGLEIAHTFGVLG